jgi:hypothetical protein
LTLDAEDTSFGDEGPSQTVPDDLLLPCGCHFHWQCLLDQAASITSSLCCPSCASYLPSSNPSSSSSSTAPTTTNTSILAHYTNEGGAQPDLDLLPILQEESYLSSHPEARPARAFHALAAEGDVQGLVALLADVDDNDDNGEGWEDEEGEEEGQIPRMSAAYLLTWQDPLNGGRSALHVALEARQEEVVWLLLWLGSGVETEEFPAPVVQVAEGMGLPRGAVAPGKDVRFVRDEKGRLPGDVCLELGGNWGRMVELGLFG